MGFVGTGFVGTGEFRTPRSNHKSSDADENQGIHPTRSTADHAGVDIELNAVNRGSHHTNYSGHVRVRFEPFVLNMLELELVVQQ